MLGLYHVDEGMNLLMQLQSETKRHSRSEQPLPISTIMVRMREIGEGTAALLVVFLLGLSLPILVQHTHVIFGLFFLIVFAIAVRYSRSTAYTTSFLAAFCYSILLWQHEYINQQPLFLTESLILLLSGILTSDLHRLRCKRYQQIQVEAQQAMQRYQAMQQQHQKALDINTELEHMIANQTISLITFSHQISRLWQSAPREFFQRSIELVAHNLEASSCTIYLREGQQFYAQAMQPDDTQQPLSAFHLDQLAPRYNIIARAVKEQRVVTLQNLLEQDDSITQETPCMAGPLLDAYGEVQGVIVIGTLPFRKCTPRTTRLFAALLKVIAQPCPIITPIPQR